jgi:hypothetical protein
LTESTKRNLQNAGPEFAQSFLYGVTAYVYSPLGSLALARLLLYSALGLGTDRSQCREKRAKGTPAPHCSRSLIRTWLY